MHITGTSLWGIVCLYITGAEMLAKKYNYPVVYFRTEQIVVIMLQVEIITENPQEIIMILK